MTINIKNFKIKGDAGKLMKGISYSWMRFGISIILGLLQTPILFKYLTPRELNAWYIFYSFGAFLQMADLGLIQTISRLISYIDNSKKSNDEKVTSSRPIDIYITAVFSFSCLLFLLGLIIVFIYVYTSSARTGENFAIAPFAIYVTGMVFTLLSNIPGAMLIGYRDVGPESVVRSVYQIVYFLILLIGIPYFRSILFVSIFFFLQNFGLFITLHFVFYKRHKHIFVVGENLLTLIKLTISKELYRQSAPLAVNQLGGWLINQGNIFVASLVVTSQNLADYAITQQIFTYVASVALVINQAMGPFIAKQYIQDKQNSLKHLFINTTLLCLLIVSILLSIQIICGEEIISIWVGKEHFLGVTLLSILAIITFLEVNHSVSGNFVWNTSSWPFNKWTLGAGVLNVLIGYILGKPYGFLGIAIATLISKLVTLNWYVVYYCLKKLNVLLADYLKMAVYPLTVTLFVAILATVAFKKFLLRYVDDGKILIVSVSVFTTIVFVIMITVLLKSRFVEMYKTFRNQPTNSVEIQ